MKGESVRPFINRMTPTQTAAGWVYLPLYALALPMLLGVAAYLSPRELTEAQINLLYTGISLAVVLIAMFSYLRRSFYVLWDEPGRCLSAVLRGMVALYAMSLLMSLLLTALDSLDSTPNDAEIALMMGSAPGVFTGLIIFLDPIVEEVMFRGVVFGSIRLRSRFWAYAVSAALFSLCHVWQYALAYHDPWTLLYALRYLPHSLALAWCYERSGSIWASIFFHMAVNGLSLFVLG